MSEPKWMPVFVVVEAPGARPQVAAHPVQDMAAAVGSVTESATHARFGTGPCSGSSTVNSLPLPGPKLAALTLPS